MDCVKISEMVWQTQRIITRKHDYVRNAAKAQQTAAHRSWGPKTWKSGLRPSLRNFQDLDQRSQKMSAIRKHHINVHIPEYVLPNTWKCGCIAAPKVFRKILICTGFTLDPMHTTDPCGKRLCSKETILQDKETITVVERFLPKGLQYFLKLGATTNTGTLCPH